MTIPQNIKETFNFLSEHAQEKTSFSIQELANKAGWSIAETKENIVNRLSDLIEAKDGQYFARPEILRVRLNDFKELLHQKKRLFTDYILEVSPSILIYEFFNTFYQIFIRFFLTYNYFSN